MTAVTADFKHSSAPEPHRSRTKEILRAHPEIRALIGPSQATFWWTLVVVALQGVVAWFAATSPGGWCSSSPTRSARSPITASSS